LKNSRNITGARKIRTKVRKQSMNGDIVEFPIGELGRFTPR
jgi:hypothetical protein